MPTIGWNESNPQDTDSAGLGDDEFRSLKTSLRIGLDGEHVWPSGGGDAGVHRLGSARPYIGTQSLVSSSGTDGRLMWASDTSNFFHVGSGGTAFIGGARVISAGSYVGTRSYWAEEFGEGKTAASGSTSIAYPSVFNGKPYVVATAVPSSLLQAASWVVLGSVSASGFAAASYNTGGAQSSVSFFWHAIGTRSF